MFDADKAVLIKMMRIECEYDGRPVKIDCSKLLTFRGELDDDRERCIKWHQRVGALMAEAIRRRDFLKAELDSLKGELDEHARKFEVLSRPTDEKVKNWVNRNPDYVNKRKMLAEQEAKVGKLNALHWSINKKIDMLVEKGADRRIEVQYGVGIAKLPPEHIRNDEQAGKQKKR